MFLADVEEAFSKGHELGTVIGDLALAYLASWIFYRLVVVRPRKEDQRNAFAVLGPRIATVVGDGDSLVRELARISDVQLGPNPAEQVEAMCATISPLASAELLIALPDTYATVVQYMSYLRQRSMESIRYVLGYQGFLDSDVIGLLGRIDTCTHFMALRWIEQMGGLHPPGNPDLSVMGSDVRKYYELTRQLQVLGRQRFRGLSGWQE